MAGPQGVAGGVASVSGNQDVRNVTVRLEGETSHFVDAMEMAEEAALQTLNAIVKVENSIKKLSKTAGNTMITIGAVGQGLTAWAGTLATKWEDAYSWIEKSIEAPPQLASNLRKLSTEIPVATNELAQLGSLGAQLGIPSEDLEEFTEVASRMGAAIDTMSPQEAIVQLSQFSSVMGVGADQAKKLSSAVMDLGKHTAASENEIFDFSQRIAGIARVVGLAADEVVGISAAFAAAGIQAERGGTAVANVLQSMSQAATQGTSKLQVFAKALGMTSSEFQELIERDPAEAFVQFVEALRDAGDDAFKILEQLQLTDSRLVQSFLTVANSATDVRTAVNDSTQAFEEGNAVVEQSDKRFNTLLNTIKQFRQSVSEIGRALGQGFVPIIKGLFELMTLLLKPFHMLPQEIKTLMGLMIGLGSAVLLTAGALAKLVPLLITISHIGLGLLFGRTLIDNGSKLAITIKKIAENTRIWQALVASQVWQNWFAGLTEGHGILGRFLIKIKDLVTGLGRLTWREYARGVKVFGSTLLGAAKAAGGLLASLLPYAVVIGAITAAYLGMKKLISDSAREMESMRSVTDDLGQSLNMSLKSTEDFNLGLDGTADAAEKAAGEIALMNSELIQLMDPMDEAGKKAVLMGEAMKMAMRGEDTSRIIREMQKLADVMDIDFDLADNFAVDPESIAQGFRTSIETAQEQVDQFGKDRHFLLRGFDIPTSVNKLLGRDVQAAFADDMESMATSFSSALQHGDVEQFQRFLIAAQELDAQAPREAGRAWEDFAARLRKAGITGLDTTGDLENLDDFLKQMVDDPARREAMEEMVRGIKGFEDIDLKNIKDLERVLKEIFNAFERGELLEAAPQDRVDAPLSRLRQRLGETFQALQGEDAALGGFVRDKIDEMVATEGHDQVIQMIEEDLRMIGDEAAQRLDPVGKVLISILKNLNKEMQRLEFDKLRREMESLPFEEAIAKMDELGKSTKFTADQMQQLADMRMRRIDQEFDRLIRLVEQEEDLNERRADMAEDHEERMQDLVKDHAKSMDKLKEQEEERLREHAKNLAETIRMDERLYSQYAIGLERIIMRSQEQNVILEEWAANLAKLRQMGLDQDVLTAIGLDDPQNFSQVDRVLEEALANPALIDQINAQWSQRLNIMEGVTDGVAGQEIREDFDERSQEMEESFEERQADMVESYRESLAEIDESIQELGEDTGKSFAEAVEAGKNSASPHIREMAQMLEEHIPNAAEEGAEKVEDSWGDMQKKWDHVADFIGQGAEDASDRMVDSFQRAADDISVIFDSIGTAGASSGMGGLFGAGLSGGGGSGTGGGAALFGGTESRLSGNKKMAYEAMLEHGWGEDQWDELHELVMRESSWSPSAQNPVSTAYGLFQFLDSTWDDVGGHKTADPAKQIEYGMRYIKQRYGSPGAALAFHDAHNWYAQGSVFTGPQTIGVGEAGPEAVIPLNARGANFMADALGKVMPRSFGGGVDSQLTSVLGRLADTMQVTGGMRQETTSFGPITVNTKADVNEIEAKLKAKARQRRLVSSRDKGFADG